MVDKKKLDLAQHFGNPKNHAEKVKKMKK